MKKPPFKSANPFQKKDGKSSGTKGRRGAAADEKEWAPKWAKKAPKKSK